jgi:hypothetical protein
MAATLGVGPPLATGERDGILLQLWLDRQQVRVGDRLFALTRVTNNGTTSPTWEKNICGSGPAPISVTRVSELPVGQSWTGLAADFKQTVLSEGGFVSGGRASLGKFWDAGMFDTVIPMGCPGYSQQGPFMPGEVSEMVLAWNVAAPQGQVMSTGTASVTATFASSAPDISAQTLIEIEAVEPTEPLTIVHYVDIALSQSEFNDWLNERPRSSWINTSVTFWPNDQGEYPPQPEYEGVTNGAVDVGLFRSPAGEQYGSVIIEVGTGRVLGTRFEP